MPGQIDPQPSQPYPNDDRPSTPQHIASSHGDESDAIKPPNGFHPTTAEENGTVDSTAARPAHPSTSPVKDNTNAAPDSPSWLGSKRKFDAISKSNHSSRPPSPPWKKIAVDGPTSFVVDGKRRSSRTNALPVELKPPSESRQMRTQMQQGKATVNYSTSRVLRTSQSRTSLTNGTDPKENRASSTRRGSMVTRKNVPRSQFKSPPKPFENSRSASRYEPPTMTRRRRPSFANREQEDTLELHSSPRRSGERGSSRLRTSVSGKECSPITPYTRLRLRIREPGLTKTHPNHFPAPKPEESLRDSLRKLEALDPDYEQPFTDAQVRREASVRLRIGKAWEPGGVLRKGIARFQWEPWEEPRKRYHHWDYVSAHALQFSKLLRSERYHHAKAARQLAHAVKSEIESNNRWAFLRLAKSKEEIWEEERGYQLKRYKQLVKDIEAKWNLVRHEVDKIRLQKWEEEQEVLGNKALDELLDQSNQLLQQPQYRSSAEPESEDDAISGAHEGDLSSDQEGKPGSDRSESSESTGTRSDDEIMSESSDEESEVDQEAEDDDVDLTQEQLREKYAHALQQTLSSPIGSGDESDEDSEQSSWEGIRESADIEDNQVDDDTPAETPVLTNGVNGVSSSAATPQDDAMQLDNTENMSEEESEGSLTTESDDESDSNESLERSENESEDDHGPGLLGFFSAKDISNLELPDVPESRDAPMLNGDIISTHDKVGVSTEMSLAESMQVAESLAPGSEGQAKIENAVSETVSRKMSSARSTPRPTDETHVTASTTPMPPSPTKESKIEVSSLLRGTLREYQVNGVDWLAKLYAGDRNGILADEMGLGKTIQTIALLAHLATHHEVWGPHLVVVPTSVILNWEMEFKKWCPAFKILTYYGTAEERKKKRAGWLSDDLWNVCITSYQLILQDAQAFKRRSWHYLILDEAHNIKNFQTQRWQTLLTFKTHSRLLLTGTPLQNNLQELWSLLYFLMPAGTDGAGGFADLEKFLSSMKRPTDQILDQGRQILDPQAQARVNKLHEILRPFLLRRLKSEVEKQMPAKYEHVVYCRLSKRQRQLYDEFMSRTDTRQTLASGNYMSIINCLMSLRKVCNHPDLFETRQIVTSFAMPRSSVASYEIKEFLIRKHLYDEKQAIPINNGLLVAYHEHDSRKRYMRLTALNAYRRFKELQVVQMAHIRTSEEQCRLSSTAASKQLYSQQQSILEKLQTCALRVQEANRRRPIYGTDLVELLTTRTPFDPPPPPKTSPRSSKPEKQERSAILGKLTPSLTEVANRFATPIAKFGFVTPAVVAEDVVGHTLTAPGREIAQRVFKQSPGVDPFHEARIRLSIAFPDKRLLQYDCGKLQRLDKLLRELQAGGHRCLIFTQMTKVLDILETFLNIHGHRYLRLDGATKIEQRQILTDRFNNDSRILAFILSSRSGGLGINLTGADSVIFYDLDWNPAMDKQCQDRCHRIGQTRDVHIYRFVSEYTIEANILRKSNQKRLLDDVIIQRGEFTTDSYDRVAAASLSAGPGAATPVSGAGGGAGIRGLIGATTGTTSYRDVLDDMLDTSAADAEANAAMDRVLGDLAGLGNVLESVEDREDMVAARAAEKEIIQGDDVDFKEGAGAGGAAAAAGARGEESKSASARASVHADSAGINAAAGALAGGDAERGNTEGVTDGDGEEMPPHVDEYMVRFLKEELRDVPIRPPKQRLTYKKAKVSDWKRRR